VFLIGPINSDKIHVQPPCAEGGNHCGSTPISARERNRLIPNPNQPGKTLRGTGAKLVERAKPGGYFTIGLGLLYDARWLTRGNKGNRFAIGAMVRYGYFTGRIADKSVFSFGPLLNISIY